MRARTSGYHNVETRNDDRRFFEFDSLIVREFYEVIEEAGVVRSEWELLITRSEAVEFIFYIAIWYRLYTNYSGVGIKTQRMTKKGSERF